MRPQVKLAILVALLVGPAGLPLAAEGEGPAHATQTPPRMCSRVGYAPCAAGTESAKAPAGPHKPAHHTKRTVAVAQPPIVPVALKVPEPQASEITPAPEGAGG